MLKYLGITEEFTACDCCGKSDLQCTVAMETEAGDIVYYGRTCAARNTGRKLNEMVNEKKAADAALRAKVDQQIKWTPEYEALQHKQALRTATYRGGPGRAARDFLQPELDAFDVVQRAIWAAAPVSRY